MNRRQLLTAITGLGLCGGSVWALQNGLNFTENRTVSVQVETLRAQGSTQGRTQVPLREGPTVIDLFATWCLPCQEQMGPLRAVHEEYGDRVTFVSVTNERLSDTFTRADITQWWQTHGGDWLVGHDPESNLLSSLNADGIPFIAIADSEGVIRWTHSGIAETETLRRQLEQHLTDS